jgi:hypothetical protein
MWDGNYDRESQSVKEKIARALKTNNAGERLHYSISSILMSVETSNWLSLERSVCTPKVPLFI